MVFKDKYLRKIINIILFYTSKGYKILSSTNFFTNQEIEDILKRAFPKDKNVIIEESEKIGITGNIKDEKELTFEELLNELYEKNNSIEKEYFLFLVKEERYIFIGLFKNEFLFIDFSRTFEKKKENIEDMPKEKEEHKKIEKKEQGLLEQAFSPDTIVFAVYLIIAILEIVLAKISFKEGSVICNFLWVAYIIIYALPYKKMKFGYMFLVGILGYLTKSILIAMIISSKPTTYNQIIGEVLTVQVATAFFYSLYFGTIYNIQKLKQKKKEEV